MDDVAVYNFEAKIDDRVIVAECRPRAEAKTTYEEAVAKGHTAFIMEQDEKCEDIFRMSIGQIPVNGTVFITLRYVGQLAVDTSCGDGINSSRAIFTLPSVINPRYTPTDTTVHRQFESFDGLIWNSTSYTIAFEATLLMPEPIVSVTSERDKYTVTVESEDPRHAKVVLASGFKPDHDLQMVIELANPLNSFAAIEPSAVDQFSPHLRHCIMAQFMPDLSAVAGEQEQRTELIFVVDRSGSMQGESIRRASESLLLLLKSLPPGCRFQIIGFGSTHAALFPEAMDYNEETLARGLQYQEAMDADMGGTEVLPALKTAYDSPLSGVGWYRQIIFLTDGDVTNADEVVGLVQSNIHKARLFSIGIGDGASTYLVSSVARAGRGLATFIRDESQLRGAVMKVLKSALEPRALPTKLHWNLQLKGADCKLTTPEIVAVPTTPPAIFSGCFSTMFAFFNGEPTELTGDLELSFDVMGDQHTVRIPISVAAGTRLLSSHKNSPLHRLAAKCLLNQLGDQLKGLQMTEGNKEQDSIRKQIEQVSCMFNVVCPLTSFIGVDPVTRIFGRYTSLRNMILRISYPIPLSQSRVHRVKFTLPMNPQSGGNGFSTSLCFSYCCFLYSRSTEEAVERQEDSIVKLVKLQQFSGSWPLVDDVVALLEIDAGMVRKEKPKTWQTSSQNDLSDSAWITMLVIAYFELRHSESKVEWELVVRKAQQWLHSQAKLVEPNTAAAKALCDKLLEQARQLIRTNMHKPTKFSARFIVVSFDNICVYTQEAISWLWSEAEMYRSDLVSTKRKPPKSCNLYHGTTSEYMQVVTVADTINLRISQPAPKEYGLRIKVIGRVRLDFFSPIASFEASKFTIQANGNRTKLMLKRTQHRSKNPNVGSLLPTVCQWMQLIPLQQYDEHTPFSHDTVHISIQNIQQHDYEKTKHDCQTAAPASELRTEVARKTAYQQVFYTDLAFTTTLPTEILSSELDVHNSTEVTHEVIGGFDASAQAAANSLYKNHSRSENRAGLFMSLAVLLTLCTLLCMYAIVRHWRRKTWLGQSGSIPALVLLYVVCKEILDDEDAKVSDETSTKAFFNNFALDDTKLEQKYRTMGYRRYHIRSRNFQCSNQMPSVSKFAVPSSSAPILGDAITCSPKPIYRSIFYRRDIHVLIRTTWFKWMLERIYSKFVGGYRVGLEVSLIEAPFSRRDIRNGSTRGMVIRVKQISRSCDCDSQTDRILHEKGNDQA
ncbi:von Willebrand factor A domain-containing protein 5A [Clonorchis sinensis]|uniref:von Willebrand factor A domain-containing protein 5A n=1 Tax=Clonorchis sinensis TaxID=79923 RepID=G7YFE1_CLOSI|nr:von Willebrand factor A domain-containing protein 5A [Clonorchis sinensis]